MLRGNALEINRQQAHQYGLNLQSNLDKIKMQSNLIKLYQDEINRFTLNENLFNEIFFLKPENDSYFFKVINNNSPLKKSKSKQKKDAVTLQSEPTASLPRASTDADKIADLKKIAEFAANKPLFEKYLDRLERQLQMRAGNLFSIWSRGLVGYSKYAGVPYKHNKLLSGFFNEWAKANGFSGCEKITGDLTAQEFYAILARKKLIKDKYARTYAPLLHGEDTHRIFWFCVGERYRDDSSFLSCPPADLYAWIGCSDPQKHYWFDLCEFPDVPQQGFFNAQSGYGNVSALSHYLHSDFAKIRMPVLFQLITSREKKARLAQQEVKASPRVY